MRAATGRLDNLYTAFDDRIDITRVVGAADGGQKRQVYRERFVGQVAAFGDFVGQIGCAALGQTGDGARAVTFDRNIYCSGAMTACHQFALGLIETQVSPEVANLSAKTLLINQRQINQSPFQELNVAIATDDPLIEKAQYKLKNHLQKEVDFTLLARELGVSQRTLIRRFKQVVGDTPLSYLQNLRIEHAKNLLENSPLTVGDIVLEVGYTDVSAFNRLFRQRVGLPPSVYRQQFSTMA